MSSKQLAFGGVICALSSVCVVISVLFNLMALLVVACALYLLCAYRCGLSCATLVAVASNVVAFAIGGVSGNMIFGALMFAPFALIIYITRDLKGPKMSLRTLTFMLFSVAVYALLATAFGDIVGFQNSEIYNLGVAEFGLIWTIMFTMFGFVLDKVVCAVIQRFFEND